MDYVSEKAYYLTSKANLANAKTDMIKWFVGLFITLALIVIGLYFKP
jgi:flagellar biogenesis protein FliO